MGLLFFSCARMFTRFEVEEISGFHNFFEFFSCLHFLIPSRLKKAAVPLTDVQGKDKSNFSNFYF